MSGNAELIDALRAALEPFDEITFAVLFGSAVTARLRLDSDLDIAVYGASGRSLEIELDRELVGEIDMQIAAERVSGRNVDLLIFNRAPAAVCTAAITTGIPLFIRDESLYSRYLLAVMNVAIDFRETERDWREIRSRSASRTWMEAPR